jgi:hypothetical protein
MALSFLYELTGDAHAIVLHVSGGYRPNAWRLPTYVHYDPDASVAYFEQTLAGQVIHDTVEEKSLREVKEKLAALGLTLGMTLDDDVYSAAVVATVAESLRAREG